MKDYTKVFSPIMIGKVQVKNRVWMGAITAMNAGTHGEPMEDGIAFLLERAKGGFGVVTVPSLMTDVVVDGTGFSNMHYGLIDPARFTLYASQLTDRAHSFGTTVFAQLTLGPGRNAGLNAPSEVPGFWDPTITVRALTKEEIHQKIKCMIDTAVVMKNSGFDGVEIHGHWGYLLDEFSMSIFNHRTDEYGGSIENRTRVHKEIVQGIKAACGESFAVTLKMGTKTFIKGLNEPDFTGENEAGRTVEEAAEVAKLYESYGYDALVVDSGIYDSFFKAMPPMYEPKGTILKYVKPIKEAVNIPVFANARMNDPKIIADSINNGIVDGVVLSRATMADPYFARKFQNGKIEDIKPCISCSVGCYNRAIQGKNSSCAVNPQAGREASYTITKAMESKKVMVVGGGVAGMEAARVAKLRGHDVELFEGDSKLGGHLLHAGAHPFKSEVMDLCKWYIRKLEAMDIPVHLNSMVSADMIKEYQPDAVIMAVGSKVLMPGSIPGINNGKACSCTDAIEGKVELGNDVIVVGGGLTGCELALELAQSGKNVKIVEMMDNILTSGLPVPPPNAQGLTLNLQYNNVEFVTGSKLNEITERGVIVEGKDGTVKEIEADNVVIAIGLRPNPNFDKELIGSGIDTYVIGDGRMVSNIQNAVWDAFEVANNI